MLRNYLLIALRNIWRDKGYALINIDHYRLHQFYEPGNGKCSQTGHRGRDPENGRSFLQAWMRSDFSSDLPPEVIRPSSSPPLSLSMF